MTADDWTGSDFEPQDAFALVGHETRSDILQALWEASDEAFSFSELRAAVGDPDAGSFNYHFKRLIGPFVTKDKQEDSDSPVYVLTVAGGRVMGAVESGVYHHTGRPGPVEGSGSCPVCEGDVEALYEDKLARVVCLECDAQLTRFPSAAGAVATYGAAGLPALLDRWVRKTSRGIRADICPLCSGRPDGHLGANDTDPPVECVAASYTCRQCGQTATGTVSRWLIDHPVIVRSMTDHGVNSGDWTPGPGNGRQTSTAIGSGPIRHRSPSGSRWTGTPSSLSSTGQLKPSTSSHPTAESLVAQLGPMAIH